MALSTQKGCSFYAFKLQMSIFGLLRGHVGESNIQEKEQHSDRKRERIVNKFGWAAKTKGFMEKKLL